MSYTRFAIYYVPPEGALAEFGAKWLGWDVLRGTAVDQYTIEGLDDATMTPRKYGFHGTMKPPFRLREGRDFNGVCEAFEGFAARSSKAVSGPLRLNRVGRFLALVPTGNTDQISALAAACVQDLDPFRAPAGEAELARRRAAGLTAAQEAHLLNWGYPYVLDEFRFHLTLTGKMDLAHNLEAQAAERLPDMSSEFQIADLALVGERKDGRFELIHRAHLTG